METQTLDIFQCTGIVGFMGFKYRLLNKNNLHFCKPAQSDELQ